MPKVIKTFSDLVDYWLTTNEYNGLEDKTKTQYRYLLSLAVSALPTQVGVASITGTVANAAFDTICNEKSATLANRVLSVCRRVYAHAARRDIADVNPWRKVRSKKEPARRVVWSRENVTAFLDVAYSEWRTRSIGLIAQMCYEWCQRVGDMRTLTWDSINFEEKYVKLVQSKRRAQVKIPISENLMAMLLEQKAALDFQPLVAPNVVDNMKAYSLYRVSGWVNRVKEEAGLPHTLRLADLRRTGTTEMCEAGVSMPQIMAVTGHSTPASVVPYMKNTLLSSTEACTLRSAHTGKSTYKDLA